MAQHFNKSRYSHTRTWYVLFITKINQKAQIHMLRIDAKVSDVSDGVLIAVDDFADVAPVAAVNIVVAAVERLLEQVAVVADIAVIADIVAVSDVIPSVIEAVAVVVAVKRMFEQVVAVASVVTVASVIEAVAGVAAVNRMFEQVAAVASVVTVPSVIDAVAAVAAVVRMSEGCLRFSFILEEVERAIR